MLRERFGGEWFTIEQGERFTLLETPFRDNAHLKTPSLRPGEMRGDLASRAPRGSGPPTPAVESLGRF